MAPRSEVSRSSAFPLLESPTQFAAGDEDSADSSDADSHRSRRKRKLPRLRTCCRKCLLFHVSFLVFAILGAIAFVSVCRHGNAEAPSQAASALDGVPGVGSVIGWWAMPARQPWSLLLHAQGGLYKRHTRSLSNLNFTFGVALGSSAPRLMFDTTKVEGIWEQVPEKFRGVFWLRGTDREELVVLQYSRWFENRSLLVVPTAPYSYAWSAGRAARAEEGEGFYYEPDAAELRSFGAIVDSPASSWKFSECPHGASCVQGRPLAYAKVQVHPTGNAEVGTSKMSLYGGLFTKSETWQEEPSSVPGLRWSVDEHLGVFSCDCVQRRTYTLEKIVDGSGEPMEPQHSEFIRIAGRDPLYLWTGWPGEAERRAAEQMFSTRAAAFATPQ